EKCPNEIFCSYEFYQKFSLTVSKYPRDFIDYNRTSIPSEEAENGSNRPDPDFLRRTKSPTDEYSDESLYCTPKRMSEIFEGAASRGHSAHDLRWIDITKFSGGLTKIKKIQDGENADDAQITPRTTASTIVNNLREKVLSIAVDEKSLLSDTTRIPSPRTQGRTSSIGTWSSSPKIKSVSMRTLSDARHIDLDEREQTNIKKRFSRARTPPLTPPPTTPPLTTPPLTPPPMTPPVTPLPVLSQKGSIHTVHAMERKPSKSGIGRSLLKRTVVVKRNGATIRKVPRRRLPMEASATSNPATSNDPTDMEADHLPLRVKGLPWLPGPPRPPKLLHASLVPLPHHIQQSTLQKSNSNSNSTPLLLHANKNLNEKIDPKAGNRASQIFRRKLLEQSISMSFGGRLQPPQRQPKRRKTRKGSNANLEERRLRRERKRKEQNAANFRNDNSEKVKRHDEESMIKKNMNQHFLKSPRSNANRRTKSNSARRAERKSKYPYTSGSISDSPFPKHLSSRKTSQKNRQPRIPKKFTTPPGPPLISMTPGTLSPTEGYNFFADFDDTMVERKFSVDSATLGHSHSLVTNSTSPVASPKSQKHSFFSIFGKRDHNKSSASTVPSPTTPRSMHFGLSPLSPRSPRSPTRSSNVSPSRSVSPVSRPASPLKSPGRSRNNSEPLNAHNKEMTEFEKAERLRKEQNLENIIAQVEFEKRRPNSKMKAIKSALIATTTSCTLPVSPVTCAVRNFNSPSSDLISRIDPSLEDEGSVCESFSYRGESSRGPGHMTEGVRSNKYGSNDGVVIKMTLTPPLLQ
ncbi:12078_t:CDS:2, partial [Acaulospora morrowiae]